MGMAITVDIADNEADDGAGMVDDAIDEVVDWFEQVDCTFSTYRPNSAISRIGRGELLVEDAPALVDDVLRAAAALSAFTDGYFDIYAGGALDPSGYVKGWAVDTASDVLVARGFGNHYINAGGDIRARGLPAGAPSWHAAVAHPLVHDAVCAVLVLSGGSVATSGIAERGAHVIDPHTGMAAIDLASVTIVGHGDLATTDVVATAALARGRGAIEWLENLEGFEALVVDVAGAMWTSTGLQSLDLVENLA